MNKTLVALAIATVTAISGCANFRPAIEAEVPTTADRLVTTTDGGTDSRLDIEVHEMSRSALIINRTQQSDAVPNVQIKKMSITEGSVYDAMQVLAEEGGLSLSVSGGAKAMERYGPVTLVNLHGSLASVLEKASQQIGFFYRVEDGMLIIDQEQRFVVELPPILLDDSLAGMTNTMQSLGARDVILDRSARTLSFRADRKGLKDVEALLKQVRESRSMIVYQINVWQVDLTDSNTKGLNWSKLVLNGPSGTLNLVNGAATTDVGLGLVLSGIDHDLTGVIKFMESQGSVKVVTQPKLAVMNGAKGHLFVGNAQTYVSKVGTNFSTSLNQVTAETSSLKTGVDISLTGDYHDGTVYTQLALDISDLVSMTSFEASGIKLSLPGTTQRQLETLGRVRPGDTILLGGITINRATFTSSTDFSGFGKTKSLARSELVLAIRPKVVTFSAPKI